MTKKQFFERCDGCDQSLAHQLRVVERTPMHSMEYGVFLTGSTWCQGGLTSTEVYHPFPGRQWKVGQYQPARDANAAMIKKLNRWLEEWKRKRGIPLA